MNIQIRSEMDNRPVLYPLLRSLFNYGKILVITSNQYLRRLIDENGTGFRNITIIVTDEDSADEACLNYGIEKDDFDFTIVDNLGVSDCDACLVVTGGSISQDFDIVIDNIMADKQVASAVIQFGRMPKATSKVISDEKAEVKESAEYDPTEKFRKRRITDDSRKRKTVIVPYPSFEIIEKLESEYLFSDVDMKLVDVFYDLIVSKTAVKKYDFQKEVRQRDESSGNIRYRNTM